MTLTTTHEPTSDSAWSAISEPGAAHDLRRGIP